jgi:hypothetical protein
MLSQRSGQLARLQHRHKCHFHGTRVPVEEPSTASIADMSIWWRVRLPSRSQDVHNHYLVDCSGNSGRVRSAQALPVPKVGPVDGYVAITRFQIINSFD